MKTTGYSNSLAKQESKKNFFLKCYVMHAYTWKSQALSVAELLLNWRDEWVNQSSQSHERRSPCILPPPTPTPGHLQPCLLLALRLFDIQGAIYRGPMLLCKSWWKAQREGAGHSVPCSGPRISDGKAKVHAALQWALHHEWFIRFLVATSFKDDRGLFLLLTVPPVLLPHAKQPPKLSAFCEWGFIFKGVLNNLVFICQSNPLNKNRSSLWMWVIQSRSQDSNDCLQHYILQGTSEN